MSHRVTCPHCDSALHVLDWATAPSVTCPRCMGRIPNPAFPEDAGGQTSRRNYSAAVIADDDVRRDNRGSGCGLAALVVLAIIGVGSTLLVGMSVAGAAANSKQTALAAVLVVTCLGLVIIGTVLALANRRQGARQAGKVFLWLFALLGTVALSMAALAVVFFIVCTAVLLSR